MHICKCYMFKHIIEFRIFMKKKINKYPYFKYNFVSFYFITSLYIFVVNYRRTVSLLWWCDFCYEFIWRHSFDLTRIKSESDIQFRILKGWITFSKSSFIRKTASRPSYLKTSPIHKDRAHWRSCHSEARTHLCI